MSRVPGSFFVVLLTDFYKEIVFLPRIRIISVCVFCLDLYPKQRGRGTEATSSLQSLKRKKHP